MPPTTHNLVKLAEKTTILGFVRYWKLELVLFEKYKDFTG